MEQHYIDTLTSLKQNQKKHHLDRYIKFVQTCTYTKGEYTEKHHFLPVSLFPDYEKDKKNLVILTGRQHFLAHFMLAKALGGPMWFAFNQMRRVGGNSILYNYVRIHIAEQISKANKGKKRTLEERKANSLRTMDTVIVKSTIDINTPNVRVSVNDPRYISGELVFYRTGSRHDSATIQKMKDNNGVKGKTAYHHKDTNDIIYLDLKSDIVPKDYIIGAPASRGTSMKEKMSNTFWITLKESGKYKRIKTEKFDEHIHIRGRVGFKGFKHINSTPSIREKANAAHRTPEYKKAASERTKLTRNGPGKEHYKAISIKNLEKTRRVHKTRDRTEQTIKQMSTSKFYDKNRSAEEREKWRLTIASTFKVIDPTGLTYTTTELEKFCKERNLGYGALWNSSRTNKAVTKGKSQGWLCNKI